MKAFIRILQYLWIPAGIILFWIFYSFGDFPSGDKGAEWFTALALLTAFSLSVLIIHFYNSREFDNYKIKVEKNNDEIEKLKELASFSSFLFDVTTEDAFYNHDNWQENYLKIKRLYNYNLLDDKTLRRVSTIAWKQGSADYAFELRKLAYKKNPKDYYNRTYLASSSQFISGELLRKSKLNNEKRFLKLLDFKHEYGNEGAYSMALAVKGRYYAKNNEYFEAKKFFKQSIEFNYALWHFRSYLFSLISIDEYDKLEKAVTKLKSDEDCIYNEYKSYSQIIFAKLIDTIIELKKGTDNSISFYQMFYPENVAKFSMLAGYQKSSFFNVLKNLEKNQADEKIIRIYLTYYFYLGADDKEADILITKLKKENKLFDRIENVTLYWK